MLTITATNFGVDPADIQIKEYHTSDMLILDGEFEVNTTAEEYAGIRPIKLTVADLPFAKSRVSTAIVMGESDGVKYCTLTKVRITDKNTIVIDKVVAYKDLGTYTVKLSTVLIPTMITGEVALNSADTYEPVVLSGGATGLEVKAVETANWMMSRPRRLPSASRWRRLKSCSRIFRRTSRVPFLSSTTRTCGVRWAASITRQSCGAESCSSPKMEQPLNRPPPEPSSAASL